MTSSRRSGLPDEPGVWGTVRSRYLAGDTEMSEHFKARWLPGAFGDRATLEGVKSYKVFEDQWHVDENDVPHRTIVRGEVLS